MSVVSYRALFPPLLAPLNWERKANCPALVRLLKAYLKQVLPSPLPLSSSTSSPLIKDVFIIQGVDLVLPNLEGVLGIFQKLLALKSTEQSAFGLLSAVITTVS